MVYAIHVYGKLLYSYSSEQLSIFIFLPKIAKIGEKIRNILSEICYNFLFSIVRRYLLSFHFLNICVFICVFIFNIYLFAFYLFFCFIYLLYFKYLLLHTTMSKNLFLSHTYFCLFLIYFHHLH